MVAYHANVPHWAAKRFAQHLIIALVPPCHTMTLSPVVKEWRTASAGRGLQRASAGNRAGVRLDAHPAPRSKIRPAKKRDQRLADMPAPEHIASAALLQLQSKASGGQWASAMGRSVPRQWTLSIFQDAQEHRYFLPHGGEQGFGQSEGRSQRSSRISSSPPNSCPIWRSSWAERH